MSMAPQRRRFRDSSVLRNHVQDTMDFYHPRCIDPGGGFYHCFKDDGRVRHGAWFRILTVDNRRMSDDKSPAGKTDYHTMGACYEVLRVLEE